MRNKVFIMLVFIFSAIFPSSSYAAMQMPLVEQMENSVLPIKSVNENYIVSDEKNEFVYKGEITFLSPIFSQNFQSLNLSSVRIIVGEETYFINLPENSSAKLREIKEKELYNIHYELNENGDVCYIARSKDVLYTINLSSLISPVSMYLLGVDEIPSWIDEIYTEEEIEEKIKSNPSFSVKNREKIVYNDTIYFANYHDNYFTYFNTKDLSFIETTFPLLSSFPSSLNSLQYKKKKLSYFFFDNSFIVFNEEKLLKEVINEIEEENKGKIKEKDNKISEETEEECEKKVSEISEKIEEKLKKNKRKSFKEALKRVEKKWGKIEEEKADKKIEVKKKNEGKKIKKTISFNKDNSYFVVKKDKLYIALIEEKGKKKVRYSLKVSKKDVQKLLKGKTVKGVVEEDNNFKEIGNKIEFDIPNNVEGCKSQNKTYMPYTAVTCKTSNQYKLLYDEKAYTDEKTGIRMYEGRYCIAVGTAYAKKIGTYIDVVLEDGTVLNCILGDVKSDAHTDETHRFHAVDGSVVEFVVDYKVFDRKDHVLNKELFRQKVSKIVIDKKDYEQR